jgi:hypothetical protein
VHTTSRREIWAEEYQLGFLRGFLDVAAQRPLMIGMHVWIFADFKTGQGTMQTEGMNSKACSPVIASQNGCALPVLPLGGQ